MAGDARFLDKAKVKRFVEDIPNGQRFSVVVEKADGTLRQMTCMQGVKKHLKGGDSTYDSNPDNVGVFDVNAPNGEDGKGAYRCFNAGRVISIKGGGKELKAKGAPTDEPVFDANGNQR